MTVKKLEAFMESIHGGMVPINLKTLIEEEIRYKKERPTVILDQSSAFSIFEDKDSLKYNGQPHLTKKKIENFVEKIIFCGADLIVCLRGISNMTPNEWFYKCKGKFENCKDILKNYEEKGVDDELREQKPQTGSCIKQTFASISNEHYKVFHAIKRTHEEIGNIAAKKTCLAVIGQDTNYLIYEGIRYYISIKSMDLETWNCKYYNRNRMMDYLGLKSVQLPMFATLCGNDIVSLFFLKNFHKRISPQGTIEARFLSIAEKIRNVSDEPYKNVQYFAQLIANSNINERLIQESLDMYLKYEKTLPVNKLMKLITDRTEKCQLSKSNYRVITEHELHQNLFTGIIDESLTSFELLRPLRKKIYGILFPYGNVSHIREFVVEEIITKGYRKPIPCRVTPQTPNCKHPGLIELFTNRTPEMNMLREKLFLSSISETLNFSALKAIPEKLHFSVLALHYLKVIAPSYFPEKRIFKKDFEMEAFLIAALLFLAFPQEQIERIEEPEKDLWVYQLNTLYLEVCHTLLLLNEACGFFVPREKFCVCNYYNGKLIHYVYGKLKRGAKCEEFFEDNAVLEVLFYTLLDTVHDLST